MPKGSQNHQPTASCSMRSDEESGWSKDVQVGVALFRERINELYTPAAASTRCPPGRLVAYGHALALASKVSAPADIRTYNSRLRSPSAPCV